MSTTRIPNSIEPYRLAASAEHLEGDIPLGSMPRVIGVLGEQAGSCRVSLRFGTDPQRLRFIEGNLQASVHMPCQRCLQPVPIDINSEFLLGLVASDEQAAQLPRQYEPVLVENDHLALIPVIEDELLLSLPQVVYHEEGDCPVSRDQLQSGAEAEMERHNPFSVLGALKTKKS